MSRTTKRIGEILIQKGLIDNSQLTDALLRQQRGEKQPIGTILQRMGLLDQEQLAEALAIQFGFPYVDPLRVSVDTTLVWRVPKEMVEEKQIMPLDRLPSGLIRVAVANPRDINALRDVEFVLRSTVTPVVASPIKIQQLINRHYNMEHMAQVMLSGVGSDAIMKVPTTPGLELDGARITAQLKGGGSQTYVELLNFLLVNAIERKASDLHLEPQAEDMRVRYRVDGMLREVLTLPTWASRPLVSRIKVVGKLDISTNNKPQDGKVSAQLGGRKLDLRISVVPSQYGEKVVIRMLDSALLQTDLGQLGWQPRMLAAYYRMVSQPQGLVLCVGPTGSGKSTTLYATIQRLRSETSSIVTVEDPIEYSLPGITQVQVSDKTGMTFGTVIRSLLRQDPNVIVIGEIRDGETADAAFEAANTGHLVLSTLHTNHSVNTLTRLLDLKVPAYLLGSTLNGIVAQRLVRRVCSVCSVPYQPDDEELIRLNIEPNRFKTRIRRAGPGCANCRYVGYIGRVGAIEVLTVSEPIREMILSGGSEYEIWKQAREEGLVTLWEDALHKVAHNVTTLEEISRVVPQDPWKDERNTVTPSSKSSGEYIPPSVAREFTEAQVQEEKDDDEEMMEIEASNIGEVEDMIEGAIDQRQGLIAMQKILVADDAEEILQLVSITLEDDYEIITAHDGAEALEKALALSPDLCILDVMMPRMSGFEVCEQLKDNPKTGDIPVLFLSARGERPHVKRGFHVGADDYLAKPFDPEELLLRVRALIRRSRQNRARR